ncbi:hypothetical protein BKA80DRAFT_42198 [Phyllosticta citrichinensis]
MPPDVRPSHRNHQADAILNRRHRHALDLICASCSFRVQFEDRLAHLRCAPLTGRIALPSDPFTSSPAVLWKTAAAAFRACEQGPRSTAFSQPLDQNKRILFDPRILIDINPLKTRKNTHHVNHVLDRPFDDLCAAAFRNGAPSGPHFQFFNCLGPRARPAASPALL